MEEIKNTIGKREIKFRAISKKTQEWVYGYLCDKSHIYRTDTGVRIEITSDTACQYIGLKDKNEKKIFEGDIVRSSGRSGKDESLIFFNTNWGCFCKEDLYWIRENGENEERNGVSTITQSEIKNNIEIIGNIYENPELL